MIVEEEIWDFFQAHLVNSVVTHEHHSTNKKLIGIKDMLGRESVRKKNQLMFYLFDDGTVQKSLMIYPDYLVEQKSI